MITKCHTQLAPPPQQQNHPSAPPLPLRLFLATMADSNCQIVQTALLALQHRGGTFPAELFSPLFRVRSCGARMDLEGLRLTWRERQVRLQVEVDVGAAAAAPALLSSPAPHPSAPLHGDLCLAGPLQSLVREVGLKVVDTIARADQVAVVRRGMVRAADGSQTQLCVIDVWRLEGGLVSRRGRVDDCMLSGMHGRRFAAARNR